MSQFEFTKMHGLSNDFVILDRTDDDAPRIEDEAALAIAMCERRTGIGADGVLLVEKSDVADVRMRVRNADGGVPEMCGNGIRCVCKFVIERGISAARPLRIETGRGVLELDYEVNRHGNVTRVTVDMGETAIGAAAVGTLEGELSNGDGATYDLRAGNDTFSATLVSMGNPHAVIFVNDVASVDLETIGPAVERHIAFPKRINLHVVQVNNRNDVTMRTWERGCGITAACGTGACAVCVASAHTGRTNDGITAHLAGGALHVRWDQSTCHVFMTGPATDVFTGTWQGDGAHQHVNRSTSQKTRCDAATVG